MGEFKAEVKAELAEIKAHVQATNGRVSTLERWRERMQGAATARSWIGTLGLTTVPAVLAALLAALLT